MIFKFLLINLLISPVFAFDKDFKIINERLPYEFVTLFESLKLSVENNAEKIRLTALCQDLDKNLGALEKENIYLLAKSEVIKNLLEYKHPKVRSFDINLFLLKRLETHFAKDQNSLHPFSLWVWRSVLAELRLRNDEGLISELPFSTTKFEGGLKTKAIQFQRSLKYLIPLIDKMDSLNAGEFNLLMKKISWQILERLNNRSLILKMNTYEQEKNQRFSLFNIPQKLIDMKPDEIKRMQSENQPRTLEEKANLEKMNALKQADQIMPEDLSPLSEEINRELEGKISP